MSTTAAEAVESKSVSVLVRWHIDGLKEWLRTHLPTWMSQRLDPDCNPADADIYARLERLERRREYPPPNYGVSNGNGSRHWIRDAALAALLAMSGWTLLQVIQQGKDIVRMQCQLSPSTCAQVVVRGQ